MIASLATTAPTQFLDVGGTRFAYRRFGTQVGTPLARTTSFRDEHAHLPAQSRTRRRRPESYPKCSHAADTVRPGRKA
jgi:hypothetical protein